MKRIVSLVLCAVLLLSLVPVQALAEGERLDLSRPCDVVSTRDGIVTRITAYGGRAQVRSGERVKRGQLLIAGHVTARTGA